MATLLTDDFNSYTDGDLVGQGSWTDVNEGTLCDVQGTITKEGAKAIKSVVGNNDVNVQKIIGDVPNGTQVFYIRESNVTNALDHIVLFKDSTGQTLFAAGVAADGSIMGARDAIVLFYTSGTLLETIKTGIVANTWYAIECQWQTSDNTVRARVDSGTWSSWYAYQASSTTDPNRLRVECYGTDAGNTCDMYTDTFQEAVVSSSALKDVIQGGIVAFPR